MTDGLGSVSYGYNQLSRMTSETRTFTGIGPLTLSYDYNLAGQLKKITDHTNMSINYGFDSSGRLSAVSGSDNLVGGVSNYSSGFAYRAWGGLKQVSIGGSHTSSVGYNSRLQANHFDISGGVVNQNYDYYNDGRISFVHNTTDINFDRSFTYDHAGRLTLAAAGGAAREDAGPIPMYETFDLNAFDNQLASSLALVPMPQNPAAALDEGGKFHLNRAFGDASTAIARSSRGKNPCRDFFMQGRTPQEVNAIFKNFWNSATYDPRLADPASTKNSNQGMAASVRVGPSFFINKEPVYNWSPVNNMYLERDTNLTPRQYRALILLHEFAHALGRIPRDGPNFDPTGQQSLKNTETIFEKCARQLEALPLD